MCAYPCWTLYCAFARAFQCWMLIAQQKYELKLNERTNEILTCLQSASKKKPKKLFPIHHRSPIFSIYWESTDFSSLKAVYYENQLTHKFGMGKMRWLNCVEEGFFPFHFIFISLMCFAFVHFYHENVYYFPFVRHWLRITIDRWPLQDEKCVCVRVFIKPFVC